MARHDGYMECSQAARLLHLMAYVYCNRERTDGQLRPVHFRNLAAECQLTDSEAQGAAAELMGAGLWGPGYELLRYLDWNYSKKELELKDAKNLADVQAHRASKRVSPHPFPETETQNQRNKESKVHTELRNQLHASSEATANEEPHTTPDGDNTVQVDFTGRRSTGYVMRPDGTPLGQGEVD